MKTYIYKVLLLCALVMLSINASAQIEDNYESLKQRAKEEVKMLNDYISYLADPINKDKSTKLYYKEQAENLFIYACGPYSEKVEFKDGSVKTITHEDGVTMEVSSTKNTTPRTKPMTKYFNGLIYLSKIYKSVSIETTDVADMRVSKITKRPDGKYECAVYFDQTFIGKRGDGTTYADITRKWVICYIEEIDTLDGKEYDTKLGDVHVISTEKIFP